MATNMCRTCYHSVACSRVPNSVHWSREGLIAFGTCNSVAITKACTNKTRCIVGMLNGHKDRVNCVRWIEPVSHLLGAKYRREFQREIELVSGSSDGSVIVWLGTIDELKLSASLSGHRSSVTAVDAVHIASKSNTESQQGCTTLIISASADSTVKIWERNGGGRGGAFVEKQTISLGSGFALDVALGILGDCYVPVLAVGGDDGKIHLYIEKDSMFTKIQSMVGHEDWIRGIEFATDDNGDLLLASCSQDCFIRLWRISTDKQITETTADQNKGIRLKKNTFTASQEDLDHDYSVSLESVLAGHEQWVYAVHWQRPVQQEDGKWHQPMCLLSASMDKTMIMWRMNEVTGVWMDEVRVGEVGGNTLGLFGCQFSPDGNTILAHGYQGACHMWSHPSQMLESETGNVWSPSVAISGHFAGVQDLAWDPKGYFLLSVGLDQTTRLHAPWKQEGKETTWHEIARPQVHGYDMQCLAMIGRFAFVSAADEKVLRVFEAPTNFLGNFSRISGVDTSMAKAEQDAKQIPEGASVPALGLSNKAVYQGESGVPLADREINHPSEQYTEIYFAPISLNKPPTEEQLLQHTLWPETQKLYGHGYEVFSVASHPAGTLVASACKASKPEHAAIILWDTSSWQQIGQLTAHTLTVTQLAFSHSGQYLLGVSRDRTWSLFEKTQDKDLPYHLTAHTDKKTSIHSRIIWACSWSPDDNFFATASRDKKVIIWGKKTQEQQRSTPTGSLGQFGVLSVPLDVGDSATAVDFAGHKMADGSYILAVGVESGGLSLHAWDSSQPASWRLLFSFPKQLCHTLTVKRLRWRPTSNEVGKTMDGDENGFQLASCSIDGSVRIHVFEKALFL